MKQKIISRRSLNIDRKQTIILFNKKVRQILIGQNFTNSLIFEETFDEE